MKRLFMLTFAFLLFSGFTLSWDRVTTYTDGATVSDDNVVYDVWQNGVQIGNGLTDNSLLLNVQRGITYTYTAKARLVRQGTSSDPSPPFVWTWAAGKAGAPGQLKVNP